MVLKRLILSSLLFVSQVALSIPAEVEVCFTPGQRCDMRIMDSIQTAQHAIYVQAYQLTSKPIQDALVNARLRGVKVDVILDKSQEHGKYPAAMFFHNMQIPVWIDYKPAIAHNKVMIIDGDLVITGSYNYSRAAQFKNAENVVFIRSPEVAHEYFRNFNYRLSKSTELERYK